MKRKPSRGISGISSRGLNTICPETRAKQSNFDAKCLKINTVNNKAAHDFSIETTYNHVCLSF